MNITDSISAWGREMPEAPALITDKSSLSFAELDRAVSMTAAGFAKAGLEPGQSVGIHLTDQAQHLIASLALARLGAGQIAFDVKDPPRLQTAFRGKLGIVAAVAKPSTPIGTGLSRLEPPPADLEHFKGLGKVDFKGADDQDLPFLFLNTSGTASGVPKIGLLTHILAHHHFKTLGPDLPVGPGMRALSLSSINFTGAKKNIYRFLISGGCFALMDEPAGPEELVEFVEAHGIGYIYGTLVHAAALLGIAKPDELLLPNLRALRIGAMVIPATMRAQIQERLTPNLYISYGITEFGLISVAPPEMVHDVPGVVGTILPGVEAEVIDELDNVLPAGRVGRLRLKSPGMSKGYIGAPAESEGDFRDGWFYSSDLAEFTPGGALIHHGRADDLMIVDGINIYPAEIENALLGHPAVAEAAAFPIQSPARGQIPVAAAVVKSPISEAELLAHCRSWLGHHTPQQVKIVAEFPRNISDKVDKDRLAKLFEAGR